MIMLRLTDTHCHLNFNLFDDDLPEVIQRAIENGIERILVPGINLETSQQAVQLSERYPIVFAAVGVHPNDANGWNASMLAGIEALASHPKVVAIGEIGLDFYRDRTPPQVQTQALLDQLALARAINKPVILHSRQSLSSLLPLVTDWQSNLKNELLKTYPGVFHSFEGTLDEATIIGQHFFFKIGIGGPVTYKNAAEKQSLAKRTPLDLILLETDAPFLSPHPYRGQRNEPARILEIAKKIAELRGMPVSELASATSQNAEQLFGWSSSL